MNLYDFDGTIYDGESNKDLIMFAIKKHHLKLVIKALKKAKKLNRDYENNLINFENVKEAMLSFIFEIENYPQFINEFVDAHMKKIKPWYLSRKTENDIIVSASCDLWINVFARRLGIKNTICTKINSEGYIQGRNCKGDEKVRRIQQVLPNVQIISAFGDSEEDKYMLELAQTGYVVEGNKLKPYFRGYKFKKKN